MKLFKVKHEAFEGYLYVVAENISDVPFKVQAFANQALNYGYASEYEIVSIEVLANNNVIL